MVMQLCMVIIITVFYRTSQLATSCNYIPYCINSHSTFRNTLKQVDFIHTNFYHCFKYICSWILRHNTQLLYNYHYVHYIQYLIVGIDKEMYGFQKKALKISNIIKIRTHTPTTTLVMLLRMLYLCSNKPNASKFALQGILNFQALR